MAQNVDKNDSLAQAIVYFLSEELAQASTTPDKAESLEVAIQCLKLAYNLADDTRPVGERSLADIYASASKNETPPEPLSEEKKKQAEDHKQKGNELMKQELHDEAITYYTKAIDIDPRNAVYYCNRAAAFTSMGNHAKALDDCRLSISIDKKYSKAYSRMGLIYSKMEKFDRAIECYDEALKLDPNNEGYKNNRKIAEEKLRQNSAAMPVFPGLPGGLGGMSDILSNPAFMNMAQQVMENPAMKQMAMSMMGSFMGAGAGPEPSGGEGVASQQGPPDMSNILQMGQQFAAQVQQENPELIEQLRSATQGPPQENGGDKE